MLIVYAITVRKILILYVYFVTEGPMYGSCDYTLHYLFNFKYFIHYYAADLKNITPFEHLQSTNVMRVAPSHIHSSHACFSILLEICSCSVFCLLVFDCLRLYFRTCYQFCGLLAFVGIIIFQPVGIR